MNAWIGQDKANAKVKLVKKRKNYFIKADALTPEYAKKYEKQFIDFDEDAEDVEDILGDISAGIPTANVDEELTKARLDNLQVRTKLLNEKIEARKEELFSSWSEKFFTVFEEAFAKFKNELINLHLNEAQINALNESLDFALKNMNDGLIKIKSDYLNEDMEEEGIKCQK